MPHQHDHQSCFAEEACIALSDQENFHAIWLELMFAAPTKEKTRHDMKPFSMIQQPAQHLDPHADGCEQKSVPLLSSQFKVPRLSSTCTAQVRQELCLDCMLTAHAAIQSTAGDTRSSVARSGGMGAMPC